MSDTVAKSREKVEDVLNTNQPGKQNAKLSPFQVLKGVIVQPQVTFTRLRNADRGHLWLVFLLNIISISLLFFATAIAQNTRVQSYAFPVAGYTPGEGGFTRGEGRFTPTAVVESDNGQAVTPQINASQSSTMLSYIVSIASSFGGVMVGYFFCAFIVFSMSFVLGGKATYFHVLRLSVWALLPLAFRKIIQAIASFITGGIPLTGISAVLTSQEALDMPTLNALLGQFDIYLIWSMILLGVGTAVTSKLNTGKSATIVIIYLVLAAGMILGLMAVGGAINELFGSQFNLNFLLGRRGIR